MYKIIGADGKEYGPVSTDQLRQWIAEGRVNAQTKVRPEGGVDWVSASDLPELASAMSSAVPPPPPLKLAPGPGPASSSEVAGPAIGLIITAILGILFQAGILVLNVAGNSTLAAQQNLPPRVAMFYSGSGVIAGVVGILVGIVIIVGALKMKKLEAYGFAMTVSILAMIPCLSPCCLVGIPIGIWSLVVLSKPEIKNSFH